MTRVELGRIRLRARWGYLTSGKPTRAELIGALARARADALALLAELDRRDETIASVARVMGTCVRVEGPAPANHPGDGARGGATQTALAITSRGKT